MGVVVGPPGGEERPAEAARQARGGVRREVQVGERGCSKAAARPGERTRGRRRVRLRWERRQERSGQLWRGVQEGPWRAVVRVTDPPPRGLSTGVPVAVAWTAVRPDSGWADRRPNRQSSG